VLLGIILCTIVLSSIISVEGANLPTVGGDTDTWGTILNNYLRSEHDINGSHTNITATKINVTGDLIVNNSNLVVNTTSGNVGIGTVNPLTKMHIKGAGNPPSVIHSETMLMVQNSGVQDNIDDDCQISIIAGNTGESEIFFGDFDKEDIGRITYTHPSNMMQFQTNDSIAMTITAAGNVGIGKQTNINNKLHVKVSDVDIIPHTSAQIVLERNGTNYLQFLTGNTQTSGILFGDSDDVDIGRISYDHNLARMEFYNEDTKPAMVIRNNNIGINNSNPRALLHISSPSTNIPSMILSENTTVVTCNSTYAGGIIYSGNKHWGCNGTYWNAFY